MDIAANINEVPIAQQKQIAENVNLERGRLLNYIKKQVNSIDDAEDILQDVLYEYTENSLLLKPIEQATSWLYAVARNKIIDLFRKKKPVYESEFDKPDVEEEFSSFLAEIVSESDNPEEDYTRQVILDEIEMALNELPDEQRDVFVKHELEGVSFNQLAAEYKVTVNTLISRKRYAVLHLRNRLQSIYQEFIND
ncbi:MAG: sigma-70 family RNA polymerase sigma factor [Bacteroidia bacterium]